MMRFHLAFYVFLFTFYVALLGFSSISLAQDDTWTKKADMPTPRAWLSTSMVNGFIYAIGGAQTVDSPISTVEAYDTGVGVRVKAISSLAGQIAGGEPIAISGSGFPPGTTSLR